MLSPSCGQRDLNQAIKLVKDSNDAACCVGYVSFVEIIYWDLRRRKAAPV